MNADDRLLADVRMRLRAELPPHAFEPQPWRGALAVVILLATAALTIVLARVEMAWPWRLLGAVLAGQGLVSAGLIGHEILHGAVYRSRLGQDLVGGLVFAPFLIPPGFWRAWHVRAHHGHANIAGVDPDCIGPLADLDRDPLRRAFARALPGSGRLVTLVSPCFAFTGQAMLVLWHQAALLGLTRAELLRMRAASLACLGLYAAAAVAMGPSAAVFALVLPRMVADLTLMAYITTNHWMDPLGTNNDPLRNTSSVRTWAVLDYAHGWFSHHQEHHLFPSMSPVFAPLVQHTLSRLAPEHQSVLPHLRALWWAYRSPRTYGRDDELRDARRSVEIVDIKRALR